MSSTADPMTAGDTAGSMPSASQGGGATGNGDFILFDDNAASSSSARMFPFSAAHQSSVALTPSLISTSNAYQGFPLSAASTSIGNDNGMPFAPQMQNASFTQYRNNSVSSQGGSNRGGTHTLGQYNGDSPFSSPASRNEDEFPSAAPEMTASNSLSGSTLASAMPSQVPPSGTLSKGTPKSKRARGHGYSSSWNGGSIQQHIHQLQQTLSPASGPFAALPMVPSSSFGGIPNAGSGSEWSGSDTSPRNPPSGSLGPPIHSLSLGDGSPEMGLSNEQLASLFPSGIMPMGPAMQPANVEAALANAPLTAKQQQEDRARQQIRADLMGVDSRALKGQLRDIQQGGVPMSFSHSIEQGAQQSDVLFPMAPVFADGNTPSTNEGEDVFAGSANALNRQGSQRKSLPNGAKADGAAETSPKAPAHPTRQFSARTQQAVDRARAQKPTRKRLVRETSERQTISPQEAFLDYKDVDALLQSTPQSTMAPQNVSGPNVFASMPATTSAAVSMAGLASLQAGAGIQGMNTPRALTDMPLSSSIPQEGTPSLIDGSSSSSNGSHSRGNSAIPSPPQRMPFNRGDTIRPNARQQQQAQSKPYPHADSTSQPSSQSSVFSRSNDLGMLSPTDSTTSSTDDEDEKPYPTSGRQPGTGVHSSARTSMGQPSIAQASSSRGGTHGAPGWGPRFSVVSSSSSESEDETSTAQRRGGRAVEPKMPPASGSVPWNPQAYANQLGMNSFSAPFQAMQSTTTPALAPSQQQAALGNAGHVGPANIANFFANAASVYPQQQQPLVNMMAPLDTAAAQAAAGLHRQISSGDAPSESGSQSQDEGVRKSPSIRSSAQAIYPFVGHALPGLPPQPMTAGQLSFPQPYPMPLQYSQQQQQALANTLQSQNQQPQPRNRSRTRTASAGDPTMQQDSQEDSDDDDDWDETGDESAGDSSTYRQSNSKPSTKTKASRKVSSSANRKRAQSGTKGSNAHGGHSANATTTTTTTASSQNSNLTVCNYISPLTGELCGTEFHRPYDLARHRETIHAREEASLLKQGKITRAQCIVLYKEVDPAKSMATVEWRCDGANGCGALFSRKDALLRHRRIRNH